jgi:hypothetical protein
MFSNHVTGESQWASEQSDTYSDGGTEAIRYGSLDLSSVDLTIPDAKPRGLNKARNSKSLKVRCV